MLKKIKQQNCNHEFENTPYRKKKIKELNNIEINIYKCKKCGIEFLDEEKYDEASANFL